MKFQSEDLAPKLLNLRKTFDTMGVMLNGKEGNVVEVAANLERNAFNRVKAVFPRMSTTWAGDSPPDSYLR